MTALAAHITPEHEMFRDAAEEQGVQIQTERLDPMLVRGHSSRLRQVVNNLIDNAIKFNTPGGKVVLDLRAVPQHNAVSLKVRDTGRGISDQDLPLVFDRFFRGDQHGSQRPGNGLGLSICKAIITSHGGSIDVSSTLGQGTTFSITLPAYIEGSDADATPRTSLVASEV